MSDPNVYALNTVSNVVSKVNAELLAHPVLGKNLVQVEDPSVCISCGDQPESVVTLDGEHIDLTNAEPEPDPAPEAKATKPAKGEK